MAWGGRTLSGPPVASISWPSTTLSDLFGPIPREQVLLLRRTQKRCGAERETTCTCTYRPDILVDVCGLSGLFWARHPWTWTRQALESWLGEITKTGRKINDAAHKNTDGGRENDVGTKQQTMSCCCSRHIPRGWRLRCPDGLCRAKNDQI
jgi:hypothetical protein